MSVRATQKIPFQHPQKHFTLYFTLDTSSTSEHGVQAVQARYPKVPHQIAQGRSHDGAAGGVGRSSHHGKHQIAY